MARGLFCAIFLALATPGLAASDAVVRQYADYAAAFDARQGREPIPRDTRLQIANCVLDGFADARGADSIPQLMDLMKTVAGGVQFDDPVVVKFTKDHGDAYATIVARCRSRILNG